MVQEKIFPQSIGFDGPDGGNKTSFALIAVDALRRTGYKVAYFPLPFMKATLSGHAISQSKRGDIPAGVVPILMSMNRYEILPGIEGWIARSPKHIALFDRTKHSGPVFAEGLGLPTSEGKLLIGKNLAGPKNVTNLKEARTLYAEWIRALDEYFPDVQQGFYISRPLHESLAIMQRHNERVSGWKEEFDKNRSLQKKVRSGFAREIKGLDNWKTIRVRELKFSSEEFRAWEIHNAIRIWEHIGQQFNIGMSPRESHKLITIARDEIAKNPRKRMSNEIRRTVRNLSRVTDQRGIHIWMP